MEFVAVDPRMTGLWRPIDVIVGWAYAGQIAQLQETGLTALDWSLPPTGMPGPPGVTGPRVRLKGPRLISSAAKEHIIRAWAPIVTGR